MAEFPTESRKISLGNFVVLPDCLIAYITCQLDLRDVLALACTSKLMRLFCYEEPLWLALCLRDMAGMFQFKKNWRQTALQSYTDKTVPAETIGLAVTPVKAPADFSSMFLYKRWYRCNVDLAGFVPEVDALPRVDAAGMSSEEFRAQFDVPNRPVMLRGGMRTWAVENWTLSAIAEKYGNTTFKVSKPMGGACQMTCDHYLDYITRQHDEEPLYIFDDRFGERAPGMLENYKVPHVFDQDFFETLGSKRPPHRWLVLGPGRSGAGWHVDPSLTSAWNSLLSGRKRWALYPPGRIPPGVPNAYESDDADHDAELSALQWFLEIYPTLRPEDRPLEFVQQPGETVFVPGGWWHVVLNLETTVAVTQNFVSEGNLQRVMEYMALGPEVYNEKQQAALAECEEECEAAEAAGPWWAPVMQLGGPLPRHLVPVMQHEPSEYTPLEAVLGVRFQRNRLLGRWLHQLCLDQPSLQDRIVTTARQILGLDVWAAVLADICVQLGLPPPQPHELFPWGGATSIVFIVGNIAIKLFCHESKAMAQLLCSSESSLYCVLASTSGEFRSATPQLLATGNLLHGTAQLCLPFMVTSRAVGGQGLGEVIADLPHEAISSTARELGNLVADLHAKAAAQQPAAQSILRDIPVLSVDVSWLEGSIPPELTTLTQSDPTVVDGKERLDDSGRLLPSVLEEMHQGSFFHDRDGNVWTSAHGLLIKSPEVEEVAADEDGPKMDVPAEWSPFVQYLRHRRKQAAAELAGTGPLPSWLVAAIDTYLPDDPVLLLGLATTSTHADVQTSTSQTRAPKPCMLHGDLSSGNVLLSMDSQEGRDGTARAAGDTGKTGCVQVLDFADAGHGDPLYDLIALWHSCFRSHDGVMAVFMESYHQRLLYHEAAATANSLPHAAHSTTTEGLAKCYSNGGDASSCTEDALNSADGGKDAVIQVVCTAGKCGVDGGLGAPAPFWPWRGSKCLSYCAMCYTLLHEEHPLVDLFRIHTELWELTDMQQLQSKLWGFLDSTHLAA